MFGKLFGGGSGSGTAAAAEPGEAVEHDGYTIVPAPLAEGGQYRTAGTIRREVDGVTQQASFIRADSSTDRQSAMDHSVAKGKQIIAEQGAGLFDRENV